MTKRTVREQSTHDRKVRQLARQLRNQDYKVKADGVRGYKRPEPIGRMRRRPDIEAKKGNSTLIIEVETPKSLITDREQLKTFTRHAAHKKGTKLHVIVTKPRKGK